MASLGFNEFTQKLKELGKNEFSKKKYKLFDNNCRDFCSYLIFNILKPSKMEICECESSNRFVITRKWYLNFSTRIKSLSCRIKKRPSMERNIGQILLWKLIEQQFELIWYSLNLLYWPLFLEKFTNKLVSKLIYLYWRTPFKKNWVTHENYFIWIIGKNEKCRNDST